MTTFIITTSGIKKFLFEDKLHREDGPAVIYPSGREEYFRHGKRHNENGHAVYSPDVIELYYYEDKLHREDGPAVIYPSGREEYFRHGKRHNENGHAVIYQNGTTEYYFEGEIISKKILDNFLKVKTKRGKNLQKLYLRIWYDQTYQCHTDAFLSRMLRDMDDLENVGCKFPD